MRLSPLSLLAAVPWLVLAACSVKIDPIHFDFGGFDASAPIDAGPQTTEAIPTSQLLPSMKVTSMGDDVHVWAAFLQNGQPIALGPKDRLDATVGGKTTTMTLAAGSAGEYEASFPFSDASREVVISLDRPGTEEDAPRSVVVLPPAFTISNASFSPDSKLSLTVSPPVKAASLQFSHCPSLLLDGAADAPSLPSYPVVPSAAGVIAFDTRTLLRAHWGGCTIGVAVHVASSGSWDPSFKASPNAPEPFEATERRSVELSMPAEAAGR